MKTRDTSLDAVCGLLIVYMIYGHICLWSGVEQVEAFPRFLFFFMPWFFFKSGMFFKERPLKKDISGGIRHLLVPYIAFSIIGQFVFYIKWLVEGTTSWKDYILSPLRTLFHEGAVNGNSPLWFLLSLFLVKLIWDVAFKAGKITAVCLALLAGLAAYGLRLAEFHNYFYIANVCCGLFFYGCGYGMRNVVHQKAVIALCGVLYAAYAIIYPSYFDFRSNDAEVATYPFCLLACIGGIVFVNWLFAKVKCLQRPFVGIGKNSITYYAAHWVVLGVTSLLLQNILHLQGYVLFTAFALANVILLPLANMAINKHAGWMIGK